MENVCKFRGKCTAVFLKANLSLQLYILNKLKQLLSHIYKLLKVCLQIVCFSCPTCKSQGRTIDMQKKNRMTIGRYKAIDLTIFSALALLLEIVNGFAIGLVQDVFALSISVLLSCISMMRWGWWGVLVSVAGAFGYVIGNGGQLSNYLVYLVGSVFVVLCLLWFRLLKKEQINQSKTLSVLFLLSAFAFVNAGRFVVSLFFVFDFAIFRVFIASDVLNFVVGCIVLCIVVLQKGLFVDQMQYLRELHGLQVGKGAVDQVSREGDLDEY